jgi:hypothetical protein
MITWNRLLAGGLRDPLLGRDVLVGLTCGLASGLLYKCHELVAMRLGETPSIQVFLFSLLGVRQALATLVVALADSVISVLIWFVLLLLLRLLLRREWLAAAAFVLLYGILGALLATAAPILSGLSTAAGISILVFVMLRFGLVALFASAFAYEATIMFPITSDFAAWYSGTSLFALLTLAAIAAYACHSALAGRPLFGRP